jgi:hypothetical protein
LLDVNVKQKPSFTARPPITLKRCRVGIAWAAVMACFSLTWLFLPVEFSLKLIHATLIVVQVLTMCSWIRTYKKVERDGPIAVAAPEFVAQTRFAAQTITIVGGIVVTLLTCVALAWLIACLTLMFARPDLLKVTVPIALLTNLGIWAFTVYCWIRFLTDSTLMRQQVSVSEHSAVTSTSRQPATTAPATAMAPAHWWTDNTSRDEIQSVGRR